MSSYENKYQSGENYKQDNINSKKMSMDELKDVSGGFLGSFIKTSIKSIKWLWDQIF